MKLPRNLTNADERALECRARRLETQRAGLSTLGLVLALVFVSVGQRSLAGPSVSLPEVGLYLAGLGLLVLMDAAVRRLALDRVSEWTVPGATSTGETLVECSIRPAGRHRWRRKALLAMAIMLGMLVWIQMRGRQPSADYGAVVADWMLALVAAIAAAWPAGRSATGATQARRERRLDATWVGLAALAVVAVLFRVVALDRFPYAFGGDEGAQAMSAIAVLNGEIRNPFGTGWFSVPTFFFFLQAGTITLFGDSVMGARMAAALLGVAAVVFTFLLTRRLLGTGAAFIAALLLVAFHYHVHFSRLSSNQIADSLTIVAVLYFLDRTLVERRPLDALLAGIAIGLSQYFSFAGRIIPLIAASYVALHFVVARVRAGRHPLAGTMLIRASLVGWILLGAVLSYAPQGAYLLDHPGEFNRRVEQVSMFASGWLEREMQSTGMGAPELILRQVWRAILLPFHTDPGGWYINHRPFVGVPMAIVLAMGLAIATAGFWSREFLGVALAYWACTLGLGLTEDPTQTQRLVVASSLMAILCAIGITAVARIARDLARLPALAVGAGVAATVLGLMTWNVTHYFGPRDVRLYGDGKTMAATELAYYARSFAPGLTVYFLGPPQMQYYGFQTLPFIARNAKGVNVERPYTADTRPPALTGQVVFAALPDRARELRLVRAWFPNGEIKEFRTANNEHILSVYEVSSPVEAVR